MFNGDVIRAVAVLEAYWRHEQLDNSRIMRACLQIDELLQGRLSPSIKRRLSLLSEEERAAISGVLIELSSTNVHVRALVRALSETSIQTGSTTSTPTIVVEPGRSLKMVIQPTAVRRKEVLSCDTIIWRLQRNEGSYSLQARSYSSDDQYSIDATPQELVGVPFNLAYLSSIDADHQNYGRYLAETMFADPRILRSFSDSIAVARNSHRNLQVKIEISPDASPLHCIHWEKLWSPVHNLPISLCDNVWLSRSVTSDVRQSLRKQHSEKIEVLVAIANPIDIERYGQTLLDVEAELKAILSVFTGQSFVNIVEVKTVTREALLHYLRQQPDIFYLVCHGKNIGENYCLYLERDDGATAPILGSDLANDIRNLMYFPYLTVLGACYSGGDGSQSAGTQAEIRRMLGVQLVEAGIPAVISMQGQISVTTMQIFGTQLLKEFSSSRMIDRAVAIARQQVRDHHDWWRPCLLLRQ